MRTLIDPMESAIAGRVKQALLPLGQGGSHATVGWMRFHGMSAQAAADKNRAANAAKLIEWFGGKAGSQYQFQKMLFSDLGSGFGVKELFKEWDEVNGTAWQTAVVGKSSVAAALKKSSDAWNDMRKS